MATRKRGMAALGVGWAAAAFLAGCGHRESSKITGANAADLKAVQADIHVQKIADANTDFGLRLLKDLVKENGSGNVFISPFGISQALSMTMNGAGGATQTAIGQTLGMSGASVAEINAANDLLLPSLQNADPKVELSVANALWARHGVTLNANFQQRCAEFYGGQATSLDFSSPSAADTINRWVKEKTKDKIDSIVSSDNIASSETVLTDAVYFHGKWTNAFDKRATHNGFFQTGARSKTLPFMSQQGEFAHAFYRELQAVSLPYGGGRMSFDIILPLEKGGMEKFLNALDAESWRKIVSGMHVSKMAITAPRFKASYAAALSRPLTSLGMSAAFQPGADFSPMGLGGSVISEVRHKAILEVDEEGTIAAAVTEEDLMESVPMPIDTMRVDHPFFCAVRDDATGTLLFAGVIRDPEAL
ncbi:MAG: serpin family protein [Capsulimonas sp.]|uniref:serpin family protein n=1 Tax=Capsulimonas sp. TaxID=2494211 RepID=UPI003264BC44